VEEQKGGRKIAHGEAGKKKTAREKGRREGPSTGRPKAKKASRGDAGQGGSCQGRNGGGGEGRACPRGGCFQPHKNKKALREGNGGRGEVPPLRGVGKNALEDCGRGCSKEPWAARKKKRREAGLGQGPRGGKEKKDTKTLEGARGEKGGATWSNQQDMKGTHQKKGAPKNLGVHRRRVERRSGKKIAKGILSKKHNLY